MGPEFQDHLRSKVRDLSDENYEESSAFYRFWFRIGITHSEITPDQILGDIMALSGSSLGVSYKDDKLFHTTSRTHLIIRFASDVESDSTLAPHTAGLQSRICTATLRSFFVTNFVRMFLSKGTWEDEFISNVNFIAVWANLGYVEESVIRNDILQSLIFEPKLRNHQVDAIIILFKIAGATFEAYADPSVVDRCFKLLKDHYDHDTTKGKLVQVRVLSHTMQGGHRADETFRRYSIYGNVTGKAFLPHLCSWRRGLTRPAKTRTTQLPHLSPPHPDFLTEIPNL